MRKRGRFHSDQQPLQPDIQERSKWGNVSAGGHEEQITYVREQFESRGSCWERTLPAFVSVTVDGAGRFRTIRR